MECYFISDFHRDELNVYRSLVQLKIHFARVILLQDFNAKISDFGLARAGPANDESHVTTQVIGTYGYAAPEYIATGTFHNPCCICSVLALPIHCQIMYYYYYSQL